jgi:hypothetical protein
MVVAVVAFLFCGLAPARRRAQGGDPSASAQVQLTRPARRPGSFSRSISAIFYASPSACQIVYCIFFVAPLLRGRTYLRSLDRDREGGHPASQVCVQERRETSIGPASTAYQKLTVFYSDLE